MAYASPRPTFTKGESGSVPEQRGRWAYLTHGDVCENPYCPGTPEATRWMEAWFQEKQEFEESVLALCHQRGREAK